jgi:hypothetical protein
MFFPLRKGPSGPAFSGAGSVVIQRNGVVLGPAQVLDFRGAGFTAVVITEAGVAQITVPAGGGGSEFAAETDKALTPPATTGNAFATGLILSTAPANAGYVGVSVNGLEATVAIDQSERLSRDCFFSTDGGITVSSMGPGGTIAMGDQLFWNGLVAGYQLTTEYVVSFSNITQ